MAGFLPLMFIIPLILWLIWTAAVTAWHLVTRKQPTGDE
jgi:hypothetical protein